MKLSRRTALILSLTSLLGLGGMAIVSGIVFDDAFAEFEREDARRDLDRVDAAVEADLIDLSWSAAQLADLGVFLFGDGAEAQDRLNQSLGLMASVLGSGEVDAIVVGSENGTWNGWMVDADELVFGVENAFRNATPELVQVVARSSLADTNPVEPGSTPLGYGGDAYLAGARTLRLGDDLGVFTVVALRLVDDEYVQHVEDATGLDVDLFGSGIQREFDLTTDGFSTWTASRSYPLDGTPVMQVQVTGDRDVYQQGAIAFLFVVGSTALISGLLLGAGLLALRWTVTGRLHTLGERVAAVREKGDLSARVGMHGNDELASLSQEFDLMLENLEASSNDLKRSNKDLGAFASVVSHDLKSPLSTFNMNLTIMRNQAEKEDDEKQKERIARMERTVATMRGRIEAVLEYSRAGREPKKSVVPLDDLARNVLDDVEASLVEAKAQVELKPLPSVRGDKQALSQVLQNLIQNAVKYRKPDVQPRIRIRAEEADGGWNVLVADNGRGFDPADAERMLQPFQRLDNGSDQQGHGVGLATVARIMEAHDGKLTADGRLGKGAVMKLWFPKDRVLSPPTPGRASVVGGLQKALTNQPHTAVYVGEEDGQGGDGEAPAASAEPAAEEPQRQAAAAPEEVEARPAPSAPTEAPEVHPEDLPPEAPADRRPGRPPPRTEPSPRDTRPERPGRTPTSAPPDDLAPRPAGRPPRRRRKALSEDDHDAIDEALRRLQG